MEVDDMTYDEAKDLYLNRIQGVLFACLCLKEGDYLVLKWNPEVGDIGYVVVSEDYLEEKGREFLKEMEYDGVDLMLKVVSSLPKDLDDLIKREAILFASIEILDRNNLSEEELERIRKEVSFAYHNYDKIKDDERLRSYADLAIEKEDEIKINFYSDWLYNPNTVEEVARKIVNINNALGNANKLNLKI
jgi:hypothetical protein